MNHKLYKRNKTLVPVLIFAKIFADVDLYLRLFSINYH